MSTKKHKFTLKDKSYMEIALDLARSRHGLTGSNPSVGCVIVKNDKIMSLECNHSFHDACIKLWLKNKNKKTKNKIMTKEDVLSFMQTYQRVTQNMFKFAPKYSTIILNLNSNHQIKTIKYNK